MRKLSFWDFDSNPAKFVNGCGSISMPVVVDISIHGYCASHVFLNFQPPSQAYVLPDCQLRYHSIIINRPLDLPPWTLEYSF